MGKLVTASFGTQSDADPIEIDGELREYNPAADLNSDSRIDGEDHAEACFLDPSLIVSVKLSTPTVENICVSYLPTE